MSDVVGALAFAFALQLVCTDENIRVDGTQGEEKIGERLK